MTSYSTKLDSLRFRWSLTPLVWVATLLISGNALNAKTPTARPNIVVLLADDLGWKDVGYHGSEIKTPNIDRLAREGVELDRFYVAPFCCPSRAGLMTGRYPHRFGYPYIFGLSRLPTLPPKTKTLATMLGEAGYGRRACIGKWHLGGPGDGRHPLDQGFNHFYGFIGGMVDYFTHNNAPPGGNIKPVFDWYRNRDVNRDQGYTTDLLTDESIRFIGDHSTKEPFFLYLAFNAPHLPLEAKPEYLKIPAEKAKLTRWLTTDDNKVNRQLLASMVECLDDNIGRVLKAIDDNGLRENTVVLFLSDNGGQIERGASDNSPLRGSKNTLWEGGVRVPAAIRWPAALEGGKRITEPMGYVDVLPTLARIAGLNEPPTKNIDGTDVLDVLTGKQREIDRCIYLGPGAIVSKRWKLLKDKLFQIDIDPSETTDVAADHPLIVKKLRQEIKRLEAKN